MTAEQFASIAGAVLSLVFSYVPGLSDSFGALKPTQKRLVMAGLLLAVAVAVFGLSCGSILATVTCDKAGALGLVQILVAALVANQGAFLLTPKRK